MLRWHRRKRKNKAGLLQMNKPNIRMESFSMRMFFIFAGVMQNKMPGSALAFTQEDDISLLSVFSEE